MNLATRSPSYIVNYLAMFCEVKLTERQRGNLERTVIALSPDRKAGIVAVMHVLESFAGKPWCTPRLRSYRCFYVLYHYIAEPRVPLE